MYEKNGNSQQETLILRNLDILAYQDSDIYNSQQGPSLAKAEIELQPFLVRDQHGQQFNLRCDLEQFKKYGPGVFLIFKFMKFMLTAMLIAIPFPLINIILLVKTQMKYNSTNYQTSFQSTTLDGMSKYSTLIINFNFVALLIITIALVYWKQTQPKIVYDCSRQICMPSYFTVILADIPNHYTELQFKNFIEQKYGKIFEIYTAKNYQDDIKNYKKLYKIIEQFKEERQIYLKNKDKRNCIKFIELFFKYRAYHQELNDNSRDKKIYEPYCTFISFENCMQKWILLENQTQSKSCCKKAEDKEGNYYKNEMVRFIDCQMEPDGVAWDNLNMSGKEIALRCGLITVLLSAFLFLSVTIIFIFVAAESGLEVYEYEDFTLQQIIELNSTSALESYCLKLGYSKFTSIPQCYPFQRGYINYCVLFFMFPLVITILKMIFASIMKHMVDIRRHKNSFEKLEWQIIIISIFYFIKSALIKFVIYRKFTFGSVQIQLLQVYLPILIKLKQIIPIYPEGIQTYNNFSGDWIGHTSHKVILISIFSFNFTILYHLIAHFISKKYHNYRATRMMAQHRINEQLKGQQFQIQMIYAQVIALFLFCMMYFSCMPIVYIFTFLSMVLLYWTSKYALIRFCKKPLVYAHGINRLAVKLMFLGIILSCIVTPMYYQELNLAEEDQSSPLIVQMAYQWQYLVLLILILVYLIAGNNLIRLFNKIYKYFRAFANPRYTNQSYRSQLKYMTRGSGKMQSYSMHENQQYNEILKLLFLVNKIEINKIGYFNHEEIQKLKEEMNRKIKYFRLFEEMLSILEEQYNSLIKKGSKNISKHEQYLQKLRGIKREIEKQVNEGQKEQQVQQLMRNKIKQLKLKEQLSKSLKEEDYGNLLKCKPQITSQLQDDMYLDLPPTSDIRFD